MSFNYLMNCKKDYFETLYNDKGQNTNYLFPIFLSYFPLFYFQMIWPITMEALLEGVVWADIVFFYDFNPNSQLQV